MFEDTKRGNQNPYIYQRRTENTMAKRTNNDLQNMHIKLKISVTRTPLKTEGELGAPVVLI